MGQTGRRSIATHILAVKIAFAALALVVLALSATTAQSAERHSGKTIAHRRAPKKVHYGG